MARSFPGIQPKSDVLSGLALPSRRKFLKIAGAVATIPVMAGTLRALAPQGRQYTWQLDVMGTLAELALWHNDPPVADRTIREVRAEVSHLNGIFNLFEGNSEISRLNRDGYLDTPSWELREVLTVARSFSELSDGAFDITVQRLWDLYAAHFWSGTGRSRDIDGAALQVAERLVDYRLVEISSGRVALGRRGMGITLNSIGQGFVADRIADMLRDRGFDHIYADLGEIRLIGESPDGRPWRIGLRDPKDPSRYGCVLDLEDIGLAVSGGYGTTFEQTGRYNHIFDPRTGLSADRMSAIAVTAPSAMIANGLATSIYVAGREQAKRILAPYPSAKVIITTANDEWLAFCQDGSFAAI